MAAGAVEHIVRGIVHHRAPGFADSAAGTATPLSFSRSESSARFRPCPRPCARRHSPPRPADGTTVCAIPSRSVRSPHSSLSSNPPRPRHRAWTVNAAAPSPPDHSCQSAISSSCYFPLMAVRVQSSLSRRFRSGTVLGFLQTLRLSRHPLPPTAIYSSNQSLLRQATSSPRFCNGMNRLKSSTRLSRVPYPARQIRAQQFRLQIGALRYIWSRVAIPSSPRSELDVLAISTTLLS